MRRRCGRQGQRPARPPFKRAWLWALPAAGQRVGLRPESAVSAGTLFGDPERGCYYGIVPAWGDSGGAGVG
jgi:hypothetical protein